MNRKVLLIEPNYRNKYPPMGLMKLATYYYRMVGDDVRFYKGDLRHLAADLICEELIDYLSIIFPSIFWKEFYPELFEFMKILWMPETFIICRRMYDADLRSRLADKYTAVTRYDCDLANEWWTKFKALEPKKLEKAQSIIALNKYGDGDFKCGDPEVLDLLSYYRITSAESET